ncbi:hypothetical protein [Hydrocarboniphaga effusa]|nr:hypothetical protein [Hydrocarboniphaga effusa]
MNSDFEQSALSAALADATVVHEILQAMPGQPYVSHFRKLISSLQARNIEEAVRIRGSVPFAGMGGFGEFLEATPAIQARYKSLVEQIGKLKVNSRYGLVPNGPR